MTDAISADSSASGDAIDWPAIRDAIRDSGYGGPIGIESAFLRQLFATDHEGAR